MTFRYIADTGEVAALLPTLMAKPAWGTDTETTGLDAQSDKVILLAIGNTQEQFVIDTRKASVEPLRPFFESREHKKVGHNLKFDYKMMRGSFDMCIENVRCTFLAEKLLNVGKKMFGFGLDDCLKIHLKKEIDKTLQKSFIGHTGDFTQAQLQYAADDVADLIPLCQAQVRLMEPINLHHTWVLECDALPAIADMEFDGVYLDAEKWRGIIEENKKKMAELEATMGEFVKNFVQPNMFGEVDFNFGSPVQVLDLFKRAKFMAKDLGPDSRTEIMVPPAKTDGASLSRMQQYPFCKQLSQWRSASVRVSTFGQAYIDAIHPKSGKIHFQVHQLGAESGRITKDSESAVSPLNVPRDKPMRNCFKGEDDEIVETSDFSGCELRIWAHLSQDPALLAAFRRGEDLHCYAATRLYRKEVTKSNENKHLRTPAKNLNFGIAYGMGPKKLYFKLNGEGFPITMPDTVDLYKRYTQEEFRVGVEYLRGMGKLAARQGWIANMNGRRRWWLLPDPDNREMFPQGRDDPKFQGRMGGIEREAGNNMIQSVNADITKLAMVRIRDHIKKNKVRSRFMNQVYDELVTRTHKNDSEEFHVAKVKIMREVAEQFITSVPMEVESEALPYWTK